MTQLEQRGITPSINGGVHDDPVLQALVLHKSDQPGPVVDNFVKRQIASILNQEGADVGRKTVTKAVCWSIA